MVKRQSLKDLQERLARRLSAAKTESANASWLAVEAGGDRYLLPLVQSGEIFPWTTVQPVPYTQAWYLGVVSLRGGLYGVIDLPRLVGRLSAVPIDVSDRITSNSRLVSLHAAFGLNAVLWVDRLLGLRQPETFSSVEPQSIDTPVFFARRFADPQGLSWQELDLQALVADPGFLSIAA